MIRCPERSKKAPFRHISVHALVRSHYFFLAKLIVWEYNQSLCPRGVIKNAPHAAVRFRPRSMRTPGVPGKCRGRGIWTVRAFAVRRGRRMPVPQKGQTLVKSAPSGFDKGARKAYVYRRFGLPHIKTRLPQPGAGRSTGRRLDLTCDTLPLVPRSAEPL